MEFIYPPPPHSGPSDRFDRLYGLIHVGTGYSHQERDQRWGMEREKGGRSLYHKKRGGALLETACGGGGGGGEEGHF
jgi:hypothetical protein